MSTTTETVALSTFSQKPTILEPHSQEASTRASINAEPLSSAPPSDEQNIALARTTDPKASQLRIALTIFQPSLINFFSSFTNGLITVGLPVIARSIDLPRELYLWPSSVYGLTSGAMLLIAGAIADIVGARNVEMVGVTLLGIFTLACGFSETGIQLVVFRALQGVAMAMHLPASVSIIAAAVPVGRARNVAFACLGLSAPLGFSLGLVLSGILIERTTWRTGFYISGAASLAAAVVAYWSLPKVQTAVAGGSTPMWRRVWTEVDWIGGFVASAGLAILAYVLAILSADLTTIKSAETASLLALSVVLLATFPAWMHYRERVGKSALIPNSLWKNVPFTAICIMVMLTWGVNNSIEIFSSLYFQEVQHASLLATSLYLLPSLITGVAINIAVGMVVHRVPAMQLVVGSALICALSPLIMALVNPAWSYWYLIFWAQAFSPFSADVLFTVGLIVVSDSFPEKMQGLAGAVFNTAAQFGMTFGIGVCQVVALGVMGPGGKAGHGAEGAFEDQDPAMLLKGYRASFWTMFAYMLVIAVVAVFGLKKAGKIGVKTD